MVNELTNDLPKRLRIVSDMINMGEKISWGQETALMDEAAAEIDKLRAVLAYVTDMAEAYIRLMGGVKHPQQSDYIKAAKELARNEYSETDGK